MDSDLMDDAADFQKCQSGDIFGTPRDAMAETIIEVMPRHLRSSHEASGNSGRYPHNGALRLSVCPYCAGDLVESEGPCQPDYEEQDRKAALTSAVVCIAAFVAGGIR